MDKEIWGAHMSNSVIYQGIVNIRSTPSIPADNHNIIAQATAGDVGICTNVNTDSDGDSHRWLAVQVNNPDGTVRAGWTRDDVTFVSGDFSLFGLGIYNEVLIAQIAFESVTFVELYPIEDATEPRNEPSSTGKWPRPVDKVTWWVDYQEPNPMGHSHQGFNLGVPDDANLGTVRASANGVVLLASPCANCPHGNGSVLEMGIQLDDDRVLNGPGFNYGFGNVVIVRYAFADIPGEAQQQLASWNGGWIFCIYGHLHELHVTTNDSVIADTDLGLRGKSGNAEGIHLHLQVYASRDQKPNYPYGFGSTLIDPNILFNLP